MFVRTDGMYNFVVFWIHCWSSCVDSQYVWFANSWNCWEWRRYMRYLLLLVVWGWVILWISSLSPADTSFSGKHLSCCKGLSFPRFYFNTCHAESRHVLYTQQFYLLETNGFRHRTTQTPTKKCFRHDMATNTVWRNLMVRNVLYKAGDTGYNVFFFFEVLMYLKHFKTPPNITLTPSFLKVSHCRLGEGWVGGGVASWKLGKGRSRYRKSLQIENDIIQDTTEDAWRWSRLELVSFE